MYDGSGYNWIIYFHTNDELSEEWELLANNLQGQIKIGKFDSTETSEIIERFDIEEFPNIKLYRAEYDDELDFSGEF